MKVQDDARAAAAAFLSMPAPHPMRSLCLCTILTVVAAATDEVEPQLTIETVNPQVYTPSAARHRQFWDVNFAALTDPKFLSSVVVPTQIAHMEYAVRGPLLDRAKQIEDELKADPASHPFDRVVKCNIGNPQALKQSPISFTREVGETHRFVARKRFFFFALSRFSPLMMRRCE